MSVSTLFGLLGVALLVWFVHDALRAREAAVAVARRACSAQGLQLLDDTVELRELRPQRALRGGLHWRRRYAFEFTRGDDRRIDGVVIMCGHRVESCVLGALESSPS